jgi:hypothetical protein
LSRLFFLITEKKIVKLVFKEMLNMNEEQRNVNETEAKVEGAVSVEIS